MSDLNNSNSTSKNIRADSSEGISLSQNFNQPPPATKLKASDYDRFLISNSASTFPSLSTNASNALPTLGMPTTQQRTVRPIQGRPIRFRANNSLNPMWAPQMYRRPVYSKTSKLGFYSPIKVSPTPSFYRLRGSAGNPFRNRGFSYSARFGQKGALNLSKKSAKRQIRNRKRQTAKAAKRKRPAARKAAKKAGFSSSDDEYKGDDDYMLPQRSIKRANTVDLILKDPGDTAAPLTAAQLAALEQSFFSKQKRFSARASPAEKTAQSDIKTAQSNSKTAQSNSKTAQSNSKTAQSNSKTAQSNSKTAQSESREEGGTSADKTDNDTNRAESDADDAWTPCDICGVFDSPAADVMVYCDGCGVAVHKMCYGIRRIPEGDWFCGPCAAENTRVEPLAEKLENRAHSKHGRTAARRKHRLSCVFCPFVSRFPRAFKKTSEGEWAHLACAIYYPEMRFRQENRFEGFTASSLDPRRARLRCAVCRSKRGYCLQCSAKSCAKSFHPMCARVSETPLYFAVADVDSLEPKIWCPDHSDNARNFERPKAAKRRGWQPPTVSTRQGANSDWQFTETMHFYPRNKGYRTEERNALFEQNPEAPGDPNRWTIVSTTDLRSRAAFEAHELIATQWHETIVGGLEPVIERFGIFADFECRLV